LQRFKGTFSCKFDLHTFPFDTQTVAFEINSNSWSTSDLVLVNFTPQMSIRNMTKALDLDEWLNLDEFEISTVRTTFSFILFGSNSFPFLLLVQYDFFSPSDGRNYSTFRCEIQLRRKPGLLFFPSSSPFCCILIPMGQN
jgi:hypothetical protein